MEMCLISSNWSQQTTQLLTHYYLEGSEDNVTYNRIFESNLDVDRDRYYEFAVTPPYKYFKLTCTGKSFYGLTHLRLYEATPKQGLKGDKGDKGEQGEQGPRGLTGSPGTVQIDPNGHLTTSSDGLRLSPFKISTQAITANAINAIAITASAGMRSLGIIDAAGITVQQQGSTGKLQIINQQISGLTSPTSDSQAVNKKYLDDALTNVRTIKL